MTIDQISVFVENQPGRLAEVTEILGEAGIDLRAMSLADTADFGVLRLIVSDAPRALEVLRAARYVVSATPMLALSIEDTPGSLAKVLRILADAGINIEYLYAFITRKAGNAFVALRVEEDALAADLLAAKGVQIVGSKDLYGF